MGFIKDLVGVYTSLFSTKENPANRSIFATISPGSAIWTPRNYAALTEAGYMNCATVFACVKTISTTASRIEWILTDRRDNELDNHALLDLMDRPNEGESGIRLAEKVFSFMLLSGNSYLTAVRGYQTQPPNFLYALRPDRVRIVAGTWANPIAGYVYDAGGNPQTFKAEEILHLTEFHPLQDVYGLSRIEVASRHVDVSNQAMEWNKKLFQNDMRPSGVFNFKDEMTQEQRDQFRKEIESRGQGTSNAGRFIITEGEATWTQMSMTAKDMDYLNGQKFTKREICSIFGVPPELLGDSEAKTYANYQEARKAFYEETVLPLMDIYKAELNAWLVPMFGDGLKLDYDRDSIEALQEDRAQKWTSITNATWLTINEKREATGYDEIVDGDVILVPISNVPLETAIEPPEEPAEEPGGGQDPGAENEPDSGQDEPEEEDGGEEEGEPKKASPRASHAHKRAPMRAIRAVKKSFWTEEGRRAKLWTAFDLRTKRRELTFKILTRQYMEGQQARVMAKLGQARSAQDVSARDLLNVKTEAEIYTDKFKAWYIDHAIRAGNAGLKATRGEIFDDGEFKTQFKASTAPAKWTFELSPAQEEKLLQMVFNSGTKVNETTIDIIYDVLHAAQKDPGSTIEALTQQIWEQVDWMDPARARLWAETETTKIDNWGVVEGYKDAKYVEMKGWNCQLLDTSRDAHIEADGMEVPLGDVFYIGGEPMEAPGDPAGSAWNVCNCRCSTYPVVTPPDERVDDFPEKPGAGPKPAGAPAAEPATAPKPTQKPTEDEFLSKMGEIVTKEDDALWEKTFKDNVEHATAWDKNGDLIKTFDGVANSVDIGGDYYKDMLKDGFFTHTHPGYGPNIHLTSAFSSGDLGASSYYDWREMRATGKYETFIITRPKGGWPARDVMREVGDSAHREARAFTSTARVAYERTSGFLSMSKDQSNTIFFNEYNRLIGVKLAAEKVSFKRVAHTGRKEGNMEIDRKKAEADAKAKKGQMIIDDSSLIPPDWDEVDRERREAGDKED